MLFFKKQKSIITQKKYYIKEVYYKIYKTLVIFLKWNKLLSSQVLKHKYNYYYNICIFSSRAKSISRKLKLSRIIVRVISDKGFFFGLQKASW